MSEKKGGDRYDVGFAKPPVRTRFQKGVSGNRKGRPPRKPDVHAELMAVLGEKVTVTIHGELREVTIQQALLMRLREEATRGSSVWATKLVLRVIEMLPEGMSPIDAELESYAGRLKLQAFLDTIDVPSRAGHHAGKVDGRG